MQSRFSGVWSQTTISWNKQSKAVLFFWTGINWERCSQHFFPPEIRHVVSLCSFSQFCDGIPFHQTFLASKMCDEVGNCPIFLQFIFWRFPVKLFFATFVCCFISPSFPLCRYQWVCHCPNQVFCLSVFWTWYTDDLANISIYGNPHPFHYSCSPLFLF